MYSSKLPQPALELLPAKLKGQAQEAAHDLPLLTADGSAHPQVLEYPTEVPDREAEARHTAESEGGGP